ncbi:MAG: hypothetical protein R3192_16975 [Woeseiaceae bacterium]|nr:hypothetical protein [Woeseiaceae bacterium]
MTLQELGNLGEFIGAIGVVVTLVFLAIQIRHNTQAIRDESSRDMAQHTSEFLAPIIKDAEFAQIFREGLQDWNGLNDNDRLRLSMLLFSLCFFYQHLFSRHQHRQLSPEYWAGQREVLLWYARQPGFQTWWPKARSRLNKSFVEFLDKQCAAQANSNVSP